MIFVSRLLIFAFTNHLFTSGARIARQIPSSSRLVWYTCPDGRRPIDICPNTPCLGAAQCINGVCCETAFAVTSLPIPPVFPTVRASCPLGNPAAASNGVAINCASSRCPSGTGCSLDSAVNAYVCCPTITSPISTPLCPDQSRPVDLRCPCANGFACVYPAFICCAVPQQTGRNPSYVYGSSPNLTTINQNLTPIWISG